MCDSQFSGQTVFSYDSPLGNKLQITRQSFSEGHEYPVKRVAFLAGLHGDELEGVFLCFRLIKYLRELREISPQALAGDVHI